MTDQLDLEAIEARYAGLSDDWSGYTDDMGDNAGRCELFSGPWVNGYRTGLVFAVREDCGCGCYPPCPQEMRFIETARQDVPALVAEVERLQKLTCESIADEHVALVAEVVRLRAAVDAVKALCDTSDEASLRPAHPDFEPIEVPWTVAVRAALSEKETQ